MGRALHAFIGIFIIFNANAQWNEHWAYSKARGFNSLEQPFLKQDSDNKNNHLILLSKAFEYRYAAAGYFELVKVDSAGNELWFKAGSAFITGFCFDSLNNIYLSGFFDDAANLLGLNFTSHGKTDGFVLKLNENGEINWSKIFSGGENIELGGILLSDKHLVLTGTFRHDVNFDGFPLVESDNTCKPFVAEISLDGNLQKFKYWHSEVAITSDTLYSHLKFLEPVADKAGNIFAIWKMCRINVETESGLLQSVPSQDDYSFTLVKIDADLNLNASKYLDIGLRKSFYGLQLDNNWKPTLIYTQSEKYSAISNIIRFENDLEVRDTINLFHPIDGALFCNNYANVSNSVSYGPNGNIFTSGNYICEEYKEETITTRYILLQKLDSIGNLLSHKKIKVDNFPGTTFIKRFAGNTFLTGNSHTSLAFEVADVNVNSVYLIKFSDSASINSIDGKTASPATFQIFPNPNRGNFNIETNLEGTKTISIRNMTGAKVFETQGHNSSFQVQNNNLPPGLYFVELQTEKERLVRKIVVGG